jgi:uracil-DNA glycosylase family 4
MTDRLLIMRTENCLECNLGNLNLPKCIGFGPYNSEVAVVGLNPSVRADKEGCFGCFLIPKFAELGESSEKLKLQGAGRAFYHLSKLAGLNLRRVYSTNAVKCATPKNRKLSYEEVNKCWKMNLKRELMMLPRLKKILVFGKQAGLVLGLKNFGRRVKVKGTRAQAVLLRHPISTLRKWTNLKRDALTIRKEIISEQVLHC